MSTYTFANIDFAGPDPKPDKRQKVQPKPRKRRKGPDPKPDKRQKVQPKPRKRRKGPSHTPRKAMVRAKKIKALAAALAVHNPPVFKHDRRVGGYGYYVYNGFVPDPPPDESENLVSPLPSRLPSSMGVGDMFAPILPPLLQGNHEGDVPPLVQMSEAEFEEMINDLKTRKDDLEDLPEASGEKSPSFKEYGLPDAFGGLPPITEYPWS